MSQEAVQLNTPERKSNAAIVSTTTSAECDCHVTEAHTFVNCRAAGERIRKKSHRSTNGRSRGLGQLRATQHNTSVTLNLTNPSQSLLTSSELSSMNSSATQQYHQNKKLHKTPIKSPLLLPSSAAMDTLESPLKEVREELHESVDEFLQRPRPQRNQRPPQAMQLPNGQVAFYPTSGQPNLGLMALLPNGHYATVAYPWQHVTTPVLQSNVRNVEQEVERPVIAQHVNPTTKATMDVKCGNCTTLEARLQSSLKENECMTSENKALIHQLEMNNRAMEALQQQQPHVALALSRQEIFGLRQEIVALRQRLLNSGQGGMSSEGDMWHDLSNMLERLQYEEKLAHTTRLTQEQQCSQQIRRDLAELRESRADALSEVESRLISENAVQISRCQSLEHKVELLNNRLQQVDEQNKKLKRRIEDLTFKIAEPNRNLLPDFSREEEAFLLETWSKLPDAVRAQLECGENLVERLRSTEELSSATEVVQCLWYRAVTAKRALVMLQSKLDSLGIHSTDQLEQLSHLDELLSEKDNRMALLEVEYKNSKLEVENQEKEFTRHIGIVKQQNSRLEVTCKSLQDELNAIRKSEKKDEMNVNQQDKLLSEQLEQLLEQLRKKEVVLSTKKELDAAHLEIAILKSQIHKLDHRVGDTASADQQQQLNEKQLFDLREKVNMLSQQNAALREQVDQPSKLVQLQNDRDQLRLQLDQLDRRWQEEKMRAAKLEIRVEELVGKDARLCAIEPEFSRLTQERKELVHQVTQLSQQLAESSKVHQEQLLEKAFRDSTKGMDDLEALRRELDLERRMARSYEHEKDHLLNELKSMRQLIASKEQTIEQLQQHCNTALEKLKVECSKKEGLSIYVDPQMSGTKEALESLSKLLRNKDLELSEVHHSIHELEIETRSRFEIEAAKRQYLAESQNVRLSTTNLQNEVRSLQDQNANLKFALDQLRDVNTDLRAKLRSLDNQTEAEMNSLRNMLKELQSKHEAEKIRLLADTQNTQRDLKLSEDARNEQVRQAEKLRQQLDAAAHSNVSAAQQYETRVETEERTRLENKIMRLKNKMVQAEELTRDWRNKHAEAMNRNADLERQSTLMDNKYAQLSARYDKLRKKVERVTQERRSLNYEYAAVQHAKETLEKQSADERLKSEGAQNTLRLSVEALRDDLKNKSEEMLKLNNSTAQLQASLHELQKEKAQTMESLIAERELNGKMTARVSEADAQIKGLQVAIATTEETEAAHPRENLVKQINDFKNINESLESEINRCEKERRNMEHQFTELHRTRLTELEMQLNQERSLHIVTRSRAEALEDDNEWLRTQLSSFKRREGGANYSNLSTSGSFTARGANRTDKINELVQRSASKAQALLSTRTLSRASSPSTSDLLRFAPGQEDAQINSSNHSIP